MAIWSVAKALQIPLDNNVTYLTDLPYTISYTIRKRVQVDGFNEMEKSKRPPELMIWSGAPEDIENWLDEVYKRRESQKENMVYILDSEIEG